MEEEKIQKDIFITYCWINDDYRTRVFSFVNELRKRGYDAEVDEIRMQDETAINFKKMMHRLITDYKKVIIILSPEYKEKANNFAGGVGNEYELILSDLDNNPKKYILVSLDKFENAADIAPAKFRTSQIIDLSDNTKLNTLHSKLQDRPVYEFSPVALEKTPVINKEIPKFNSQEQEDEEKMVKIYLHAQRGTNSMYNQEYTEIKYTLQLGVHNLTKKSISDYSIEVLYPKSLRINGKDVVNSQNWDIQTLDNKPQIQITQDRPFELQQFSVLKDNITDILNADIIVKIYTTDKCIERKFSLSSILFVWSELDREEVPLTKEHIHPSY